MLIFVLVKHVSTLFNFNKNPHFTTFGCLVNIYFKLMKYINLEHDLAIGLIIKIMISRYILQ